MYFGKKPVSCIFVMLIFVILLSSTARGMGSPQKFPRIEIQAPEAKLSPVILGSASVFMSISNAGESEDTLTEARVDIPGAVAEIHDMKDGKMVKAEKIRIPSKNIVELKPGGLHIMIFKMPEDIKEGYEFKMHLVFEKSGERQINVKLKGVDTHLHMHH